MQFPETQGLSAWQVGFTGQREYGGKIARSRAFWFSQLVWANDLQGALDAAIKVFFRSQPTGAILLPSTAFGACLVVPAGSERARGYFRANPSEEPDQYDADSEICRVNITKMKAMSGDMPSEPIPVSEEPPTYVVEMPSTLYHEEGW